MSRLSNSHAHPDNTAGQRPGEVASTAIPARWARARLFFLILLIAVGILSIPILLSAWALLPTLRNSPTEPAPTGGFSPTADDARVETKAAFLKPGPSRVAIGSFAYGDDLQSVSKIIHYFISWRPEDLPAIDNAVKKAAENGRVAMISWEPRLASEPDPSPVGPDRLVLQRIANGELDGYLNDVARVLKDTQQPVILRFAHEMDLPFDRYHGWYGLSPDVYIAAYRHIYRIFKEEEVDNVIWLWSPGGRFEVDGRFTSMQWYPGVEYVDMVGLSVFVYWRWEEIAAANRQLAHSYRSPEEAIGPAYSEAVKLNKPVILAEVGADLHPSRKEERVLWLLTLLDLVKQERFEAVVAVVFFNAPHPVEDFNADWRLDSGELGVITAAIWADEFFDAGPEQKAPID